MALGKAAVVTDPAVRGPVEQFATWHHLRRLRQASVPGQGSAPAVRYAKQEITEAIKFLTWLHSTHPHPGHLPATGRRGVAGIGSHHAIKDPKPPRLGEESSVEQISAHHSSAGSSQPLAHPTAASGMASRTPYRRFRNTGLPCCGNPPALVRSAPDQDRGSTDIGDRNHRQ
jgi:hypothetical protein